jgi:hypothetical protein
VLGRGGQASRVQWTLNTPLLVVKFELAVIGMLQGLADSPRQWMSVVRTGIASYDFDVHNPMQRMLGFSCSSW